MSSVTEILPGLWLGDLMAVHDTVFMKDKQIQMIVNCSNEVRYDKSNNVKIRHSIQFSQTYDHSALARLISECCVMINNNIGNYNVLVYCQTGNLCAPLIIILYIMKYGNMTVNRSIKSVMTKRPAIQDCIEQFVSLIKLFKYFC